MLILTQDRKTIVNLDHFETVTVEPCSMSFRDGKACIGVNYEVRAIRSVYRGEQPIDSREETLGSYSEPESALAILANIIAAAGDGEKVYITE